MSTLGGPTMIRGGGGLGRRVPTDWKHVERYGLRDLAPTIPLKAELLFYYAPYFGEDQGDRNSCVGHAGTRMMAILNGRFYDWNWLWERAKAVDEWADTHPGDNEGTSVRAACDVLRTLGHCLWQNGAACPPNVDEGISENRWATSIDEIRAGLAGTWTQRGTTRTLLHAPVAIGINWYSVFDQPSRHNQEWWIGIDPTSGHPASHLGTMRGGHAVCLAGVSDVRQAFLLLNNWGRDYPPVWLPYAVMDRLLHEDGEAAIVTDRPTR